jgi:putative ABC transport system permease protein
MQVLRDAVRALRVAPGFTTTALLVLALAIGASTIVFSVVDTVVIRRLPFDSPDRLVTIAETTPNGPSTTIAPEEFQAWQSFDVFTSLAVVGPTKTLDSGAGGDRLEALQVSAGLFPVLRAQPILGRVFTRENELAGHDDVAVISYGLWQRGF